VAAEATKRYRRVNPQQIKFSVMLPEHLEQIVQIERQSFSTPWSYNAFKLEVTENDFAFYTVALDYGKVIAYAGMWIVLDEAHITNVAVHPGHRGNGIGRAMMMEQVGRAVIMGVTKIFLEVRVSNNIARNLYYSLGFKDIGWRRKYYSDNNEDAIIMLLDLMRER